MSITLSYKIKYWQLARLSIHRLLQLSLCHYCSYFKPSFHFQRFFFSSLFSSFLFFLYPFFSIPSTSLLLVALLFHGFFFSQKRREHSPTPFEGKGSSRLAQGEVQEVVDRPAFLLRDSWYTSNLFFPQVSHDEAPPSPHIWVFSGQSGFASSTQILYPREILDLQIKRGSRKAIPIFFDFVPGKITSWSSWVDKSNLMVIFSVVWNALGC